MNHPSDLKYAETHEWAKQEDDLIVTGISDHAQDSLGDLVYVEAPEVRTVVKGEQAGGWIVKPPQIFMRRCLVWW